MKQFASSPSKVSFCKIKINQCINNPCFSCLDFDIAFNKPVTASSAWEDDLVLYAAKYATNGQANCTDPNGPTVHTKREDNAWIEVDLQKTYFIKTVVVEPRTGEF